MQGLQVTGSHGKAKKKICAQILDLNPKRPFNPLIPEPKHPKPLPFNQPGGFQERGQRLGLQVFVESNI